MKSVLDGSEYQDFTVRTIRKMTINAPVVSRDLQVAISTDIMNIEQVVIN